MNWGPTSWHIMSTVRTYGTKITGMDGISFLEGGEADVRSVVAHNVHEADRIGRVQEGGMGLLMFGPLTEYLDMPGSEKDITCLGRWATMLLKGGTGVQRTRSYAVTTPAGAIDRTTSPATPNSSDTKSGNSKTT